MGGLTSFSVSFSYTLREGLSGFRRARLAAFTSVSALAIALVLIGLFALLGWLGQQAVDLLRRQVGQVEVYLDDASPEETERLQARLESITGVDSVGYVSQEEAAVIFREEFGEEARLFDDELFLPASFRVRLTGPYAAPDSLAAFQSVVERWQRVDEVAYDPDVIEDVLRNGRIFSSVGLGVGALVVIAALLLVGNTIRLSIYARRMLIRTMKLVGATNAFIRRPFLVEGLVQGLVAGVLAAAATWGLYTLILNELDQADALHRAAMGWPGGSAWIALGGLVLLGMLLGLLASWVSVRRFIRHVRLSS